MRKLLIVIGFIFIISSSSLTAFAVSSDGGVIFIGEDIENEEKEEQENQKGPAVLPNTGETSNNYLQFIGGIGLVCTFMYIKYNKELEFKNQN